MHFQEGVTAFHAWLLITLLSISAHKQILELLGTQV